MRNACTVFVGNERGNCETGQSDTTINISIVKSTRCTNFEFIEYHSTCFGRSFRPSSGVQDCTRIIRYMSYRLVDCLVVGTRWNPVPSRARQQAVN